MRRWLVGLLLAVGVASPCVAQDVLRIAVSPFLDRSGGRTSTMSSGSAQSSNVPYSTGVETQGQSTVSTKGNLGGQVADAVITELVKLGRYEIIERIELEKIIAEQQLQLANMDSVSQASEAARILGADLLVTGSITEAASAQTGQGYLVVKKKELIGRVVVDSRLIDITSTRALWGTTTEGVESLKSRKIVGFGKDDLAGVGLLLGKAARTASDKLVRELVPVLDGLTNTDLTASSLVTEVVLRGDTLYFGVGSKVGVRVGDRFDINVLGEPFKIGDKTIREEIKVATVMVEISQAEYSTAKAPAAVLNLTKSSLEGMTAERVGGAVQ